jgi:hypothetical protein
VPSLATCGVSDSDGQEGRQVGGQAGGQPGGETRRQAGLAAAGVHAARGAHQGGAAVEADMGWVYHLHSRQWSTAGSGAQQAQQADDAGEG